MASTITAADLKVKITEECILNGKDQGGTNTKTIASIAEISKRIVTITTTEAEILKFAASVDAGRYIIGDVRYNIKRSLKLIHLVGEKLKKTKITNSDFEKVIVEKPQGKKVFLFLDPPYAESRQIAAYNIHFEQNDHERLAKLLKKTNHPFLLTYDDCEYVRKLYQWANFYDHTWT